MSYGSPTVLIDIGLDLERLLKLRLVVARFGEMDVARWWNSDGMLSRHGLIALRRGFPTTHYFAQARAVMAVARARCAELFDRPGCVTLWHLPAVTEDDLEDAWQVWLDEAAAWIPFFEQLAGVLNDAPTGHGLLDTLAGFGLLSSPQRARLQQAHRSAEGRAVALPGTYDATDDVITLLAAGFALGELGRPAIPFARLEN